MLVMPTTLIKSCFQYLYHVCFDLLKSVFINALNAQMNI
jgi:hypothetical protein